MDVDKQFAIAAIVNGATVVAQCEAGLGDDVIVQRQITRNIGWRHKPTLAVG